MTGDGSAWVGVRFRDAILWHDGATISLGAQIPDEDLLFRPLLDSIALSISDDRSRVAGSATIQAQSGLRDSFAVLWEEGVGRNLNVWLPEEFGVDLTGWDLTQAIHVSRNGLFLYGIGIGPDGEDHAWSFTIPEPASIFLVPGLAALILARRRS